MEKYPDQDLSVELVEHAEEWEHWATYRGTRYLIRVYRDLTSEQGYDWWVMDLDAYEGGPINEEEVVDSEQPAASHEDALNEALESVRTWHTKETGP